MLNAVSSLKDFDIQAKDGGLGSVSDFLFDDSTWKLRWMVVDTGGWLSGRKVLIHPSAVISVENQERQVRVSLTKDQVKDSPDILQDRPISQQMQNDLYSYYGWDPLWGGGMLVGGIGAMASPLSASPYFSAEVMRDAARTGPGLDVGDPHLRSVNEVTGYHVHATDGDIGHVQDFLIDTASWDIRYLIVDTSNWWIGQQVLISPYAVHDMDWSERHVRLDLTREKIKCSPKRNPSNPLDGNFERRLHDHYGWPGYGW